MTSGFLQVSGADFAAVAPEIVLCLAGTLILLLDAFARPLRPYVPYLALLALAVANLAGRNTTGTFWAGAVESSGFTRYIELIALGAVALAILGGAAALERDKRDQGEFYALLLFSAAGLILMVRGADLLVVFIGLELMSLCLYVLAAWYRDLPAATEAGLKYFLMGALASTFLLYGVATIYGRLGTTSFAKLQGVAGSAGLVPFDTLLAVGLLAVVAGLAFKIALVPFHGWAPDVYQGMTTPAVAFLSTAPKAGAVLVLIRILHALFPVALARAVAAPPCDPRDPFDPLRQRRGPLAARSQAHARVLGHRPDGLRRDRGRDLYAGGLRGRLRLPRGLPRDERRGLPRRRGPLGRRERAEDARRPLGARAAAGRSRQPSCPSR